MDHKIFCTGPLLHAVEMSGLFTDSKSFVDRPLLAEPDVILAEFEKLGTWPNINQKDLKDFVEQYFAPVGSDLENIIPADFKQVNEGGLPVYQELTDENLKLFAEKVHHKWSELGRKVSDDVKINPTRHTIIPIPHPFIVPGGRFREIYYWDSYWTIQGLMASGMAETAKGMLLNFVYLIERYGLIPNGNRIYYSQRSEPPLFALMVDHYMNHKNVSPEEAKAIIGQVLPALEKEYAFWMKGRSVEIKINKETYILNRYTGGDLKVPRPESYWEDYHDGETLEKMDAQSAVSFYGNIAAAAESGLDFSTRWLEAVGEDFLTMRTDTIVPVDLNAFLYAHERVLGDLYQKQGNVDLAEKYHELALKRGDAMHAVFWNADHVMWRDYDLKLCKQREAFYLSNVVPLFTRCNGKNIEITSTAFMRKILESDDLRKVTSYPGGHPVSFSQSAGRHCQWDFPNAWPPLQLMLIEGGKVQYVNEYRADLLLSSGFHGNPDFHDIALEWSQKWISVVYIGFASSAYIYEKYDARQMGSYGSGGEYVVQEGFGWTNGGILRLLEMFPTELVAPPPAVDGEAKPVESAPKV